ncbi:MAG: zinc ribbon domain-containing protein [Candidatus Bathyarchaeia archaeon]
MGDDIQGKRSSKTHKGGGLIEFNNHLYMHIYDTEGLEIWKYMTPSRTVTSAQTSTTSVFSTPIQTLTTAKLTTAKSGWGIKEYAIITVAAAVPALALFILFKSTIFAKSKGMAAYCIHCGALINESDEFCRKCGKPQR